MVTRRLTGLAKLPLLREGAALLGLYWLYSLIRWFIARDSSYEAIQNAYTIIQLETQLGIFHEANIQRWLIDNAMGAVHVANEFYTIGYFPVLIVCGALLHRYGPDRFQTFKLTFLMCLGFALVSFSLFPLAPPRMLPEVGFVDTQKVFSSGLYNDKTVLSFYNPYAAMPSLHFGWSLLVGIMAYTFQRRSVRLLGVLYPTCMSAVIVTTGHHYFLDIVGGGVIVGLALALVKVFPLFNREMSTRPAGATGNLPFEEQFLGTRPSIYSPDQFFNSRSRQRQEFIERQTFRSTLVALLLFRRPPL